MIITDFENKNEIIIDGITYIRVEDSSMSCSKCAFKNLSTVCVLADCGGFHYEIKKNKLK